MLSYEELFKKKNKSMDNKPSTIEGTESQRLSQSTGTRKRDEQGLKYLLCTNFSLEDVILREYSLDHSLEEETPFDGLGDDDSSFDNQEDPFEGAGDDPFGTNSDPFGGNEAPSGNPFDGLGSDDDSGGDIFGSGDDGGGNKAPKKLTISRKEILDQKFDMSKIIRTNFPDYILTLKEVTTNAIDIVEKKHVHPDLATAKTNIVNKYKETLKAIEEYIKILDSEAYEDIFTTYVSFWTILNGLKKAANNLI